MRNACAPSITTTAKGRDRAQTICSPAARRGEEDRALQLGDQRAPGVIPGTIIDYLDLFLEAPFPYLVLDRNGVIREVNCAAASLLGRSRADLTGVALLGYITSPLATVGFPQHLEESVKRGAPAQIEFSILRSDGTEIPVQLSTSAGKDPVTSELRYRIALQDMTAIARCRSELERTNRELKEHLAASAAELRGAREELAKSARQRQHLEAEIIETSEREKRKFGQHLHNETCQSLTGLSFLATVIARRLEGQPEAHAAVEQLAAELRKVVEQTRHISWSLDPVVLDGGLVAALHELARQTGETLSCELNVPPDLELPEKVALILFRIAKEAAQNAAKHSGGTEVSITISRNPQRLMLVVEDNGVGFKIRETQNRGGLGIHMMRYRAHAVGAELTVENIPSGGTRVSCFLPASTRLADRSTER